MAVDAALSQHARNESAGFSVRLGRRERIDEMASVTSSHLWRRSPVASQEADAQEQLFGFCGHHELRHVVGKRRNPVVLFLVQKVCARKIRSSIIRRLLGTIIGGCLTPRH